MPKVRRSKKPPPDGWELIEPTLEELEQKMREGEFSLVKLNAFNEDVLIRFILLQPKPSLMKAKGNKSLCGRYLKFIIRNLVIYTIYFIGEKQSVAVSII